MGQFCGDTPKKYPQNLHTPKNIYFLKIPKNIEIQNFELKNNPSLRIYKNVRVPPWDDIKLLRKSEKYFFSQAVARY